MKPLYSESYGLIVGINEYDKASPLLYAKNDAEAIKEILKNNFESKDENIVLLLVEEATKKNICI